MVRDRILGIRRTHTSFHVRGDGMKAYSPPTHSFTTMLDCDGVNTRVKKSPLELEF